MATSRWHDLLSDSEHQGGPRPADELLSTLPHALLLARSGEAPDATGEG